MIRISEIIYNLGSLMCCNNELVRLHSIFAFKHCSEKVTLVILSKIHSIVNTQIILAELNLDEYSKYSSSNITH